MVTLIPKTDWGFRGKGDAHRGRNIRETLKKLTGEIITEERGMGVLLRGVRTKEHVSIIWNSSSALGVTGF